MNLEKTPVVAYSPKGVAEASSLSLRKVMQDIAAGHLKSYRKGRRHLILAEDLQQYLRNER